MNQLRVGLRTYELRYNRCHKKTCTVCYGRQFDYAGPPGHGPYWYLCFTHGSKWVRLYIGKILDTKKFIADDGGIDWDQVLDHRRARLITARNAAAARHAIRPAKEAKP